MGGVSMGEVRGGEWGKYGRGVCGVRWVSGQVGEERAKNGKTQRYGIGKSRGLEGRNTRN